MAGGLYIDVAELINLQHCVAGLPLQGSHTVNSSLVGRHKSVLRGRGLNFEELRRYKVGDDTRHMDWKVTKRTGKPHVRVYAEERECPVLLLVDQRLSMFFGSKRVMKSVAAAELTALLAWHALAKGDRIGGLVFGDNAIAQLRPRQSPRQVLQLFTLLADYSKRLCEEKTSKPQQLNVVLQRALNLAKQNSRVYVISDFDGADSVTGELLTQLNTRNKVTIGFIHDPLEQQLPKAGNLAVSDGEYQLEIDTNNEALRDEFEQFFAQRLRRAKNFLDQLGISILPINTVTPVAQQLSALLGVGADVRLG